MIFGKHQVWFEFLYNSNPNVPCAEWNNQLKCMYTNDVFVMKIKHTIPSSVWQGSTIDLIHCRFLNIFCDGMLLRALVFLKSSFVSNLCSPWMISKVLPLLALFFFIFSLKPLKDKQIIECTEMKPECFLKSSNLIVYVHFTKTWFLLLPTESFTTELLVTENVLTS